MFNNSLLKYVSPESLLAWHRVRLANLMAHSGKEWAEVYKQYNSGVEIFVVSRVNGQEGQSSHFIVRAKWAFPVGCGSFSVL